MELKEYFSPLLKWWWLIVIATAVAAGASLVAARQQPDLYRSSTTLMVGNAIENPNPTNNDLFITQQLAAFYVNLAERSSVRNDARQVLGLDRLPDDIVVRQLTNTNIIEIIVTDTDPVRAQVVASELARQLILRGPSGQEQQEQAFVDELLANYETAITETQAQIATKQEELGELVSAREIARVQSEIGELQTSLRTLETNYTTLLGSTQQGATNTIRVIEPANMGYQVQPNSFITIIVAGGIGFVLAASAAYLLEYLDDTIRTPEQITRIVDLPTLAGIAQVKGKDKNLVTVQRPRDPVSEAFRVLRTNIQFTNIDHPHRSVLMTSGVPMEGKSATVSNLGVVLAQAGHEVLLIDADLRRPSQHEIFDLPNRQGLTELLLAFEPDQLKEERVDFAADFMRSTQIKGLSVLTSGSTPPYPSELLGSEKMALLIKDLLDQVDYLLFDSPPLLSVTDAAVLGTIVDGTVLVVRAGKSRKDALERSIEQLRDVHVNVIGCVLNGLPLKSEGFSAYYYYQDSYYHESAESEKGSGDKQEMIRRWRDRILRREKGDPDPVSQQ